jgi:hypothetical protein
MAKNLPVTYSEIECKFKLDVQESKNHCIPEKEYCTIIKLHAKVLWTFLTVYTAPSV